MKQHIETKELPEVLKNALKNIAYTSKDIEVESATDFTVTSYAGKGQRSFVLLVNLTTGELKKETGSWGGSNMFTKTLVDDSNVGPQTLPQGFAVIKGSTGYPQTFATIYVHPENINKMLPENLGQALSEKELRVLKVWQGYKSAYRREELQRGRYGEPESALSLAEIDSLIAGLVSKGLMKQNKAGACQITTKGKNATVKGV